jgi:hypothetical protein
MGGVAHTISVIVAIQRVIKLMAAYLPFCGAMETKMTTKH